MSKSEDYLDQLLQEMSNGGAKKKPGLDDGDAFSEEKESTRREIDSEAEAFLKEFEQELLEGDGDEDFLKDFEQEMNLNAASAAEEPAAEPEQQEPEEPEAPKENRDLIEDLGQIVDSAKKEMEETVSADSLGDLMIDTMNPNAGKEQEEGLSSDIADKLDEIALSQLIPDTQEENAASAEGAEASVNLEEPSLLDIFGSDVGFSDIKDILAAEGESVQDLMGQGGVPEEASAEELLNSLNAEISADENTKEEPKEPETKSGKTGKKPKKQAQEKGEGGFFSKLGLILFGADDEEEEDSGNKKAAKKGVSANGAAEGSLEMLNELGAAAEPAKEKKAEKPKKEKKKKEKKEKAKEKPKKPPKPKKEKPPKPPKEPDHSPPLPKVPVILIFIMTGSLLGLIIAGTNLVGYTNHFSDAKSAYDRGNYNEAFRMIAGVDVKEKDAGTYERYRIMAMISGEYEAYLGLMKSEVYDMALDSLIRAAGRCEKYRFDAEEYGCTGELNGVESAVETALVSTFGISKEEALRLYGIEDRTEYSVEIYQILKRLGLEKAVE